jgi:hypothetical protein
LVGCIGFFPARYKEFEEFEGFEGSEWFEWFGDRRFWRDTRFTRLMRQ